MFRYLLLGLLPALVTGFSAPAMAFFGDFGLPQEVKTAMKDSSSVNVSDRIGFIRFWPRSSETRSDHCFVFYPGANVPANAYSPLTRALAEAGFPSYILKVPGRLAIAEPFAADRAKLDSHRDCSRYVIGGHSLGGTVASSYVDHWSDDDLLLLASYPGDSTDISDQDSRVVSIYATEDGLTTAGDIQGSVSKFAYHARFVEIQGGNHAQFGWYGDQRGDGQATISHEEQQAIVIDEALALLRGEPCQLDSDCGGTACAPRYCADDGLCATTALAAPGTVCENGGNCNDLGGCVPEEEQFCKGAQAIIANTDLVPRNAILTDFGSYTSASASPYCGEEDAPFTVVEHSSFGVTEEGETYAQTVMCKMKSWEALNHYFPGSAAPGSDCSTINEATYAQVLSELGEGEAQQVAELVFDEWESFTGSQWTSQAPAVTAYTSTVDGKVHVLGKSLFVDLNDSTIFIGPDKKGVHYCQVIAPEHLRKLILGTLVAPSCDPPPAYEAPVLLPSDPPLWDCQNP